ncbi:MAG: shikimate dehydrogenase [Acidimicrobiales bacterium]
MSGRGHEVPPISARTRVVGVIGDPVGHSLSPTLHNAAFGALGLDWVSVGFPVTTHMVKEALAGLVALDVAGVSVTMPHKGAVAGLLDEVSELARRLGAVNCVENLGGRLRGTNTDGQGFLESLKRGAGFEAQARRCVVLGAGGAARAVALALADAGAAEVVVLARREERAREVVELLGGRARTGSPRDARDADLVVNATPVGMAGSPSAASAPLVDASVLAMGQLASDLVYHPQMTPWLIAARAAGAEVLGGLGMLVHQAAAQIRIWTGLEAPVEAMWRAARDVPMLS